jgi:hypothetical protein
MIMEKLAKIRPRKAISLTEGTNPPTCGTMKMHAHDTNPDGFWNMVHIKIIFCLNYPKFGIVALKDWEIKLR